MNDWPVKACTILKPKAMPAVLVWLRQPMASRLAGLWRLLSMRLRPCGIAVPLMLMARQVTVRAYMSTYPPVFLTMPLRRVGTKSCPTGWPSAWSFCPAPIWGRKRLAELLLRPKLSMPAILFMAGGRCRWMYRSSAKRHRLRDQRLSRS